MAKCPPGLTSRHTARLPEVGCASNKTMLKPPKQWRDPATGYDHVLPTAAVSS